MYFAQAPWPFGRAGGSQRVALGIELLGNRLAPITVRVGLAVGACWAHPRALQNDYSVEVWNGGGGPVLGYDVVQYGGLSAFVMTGLMFGNVRLDANVPGYTEFASRLETRRERLEGVSRPYRAWLVEVGGDYRVGLGRSGRIDFELLWSYRIGYQKQVSSGPWETGSADEPREIGGGPGIDTSGPRALLGAGLAIY